MIRLLCIAKWSEPLLILCLLLVPLLLAALAFPVSLILGFTLKREPHRTRSRTTAWILACGLVALWAVLFVAYRLSFGPPPPTITELAMDYPRQHTRLASIVAMSDRDRDYSRVAPDFVEKFVVPGQQTVSADETMPAQRWDEYRKVYRASRIHLGLSRNQTGDVFIMVESEGWLDMGHASGYLFCQPNPVAAIESERRFEPCRGTAASGAHPLDGTSAGYKFQRLADHWFAFDQGPG